MRGGGWWPVTLTLPTTALISRFFAPEMSTTIFLKIWTVGVLFFINLLNYMDRYTVAGKFRLLYHLARSQLLTHKWQTLTATNTHTHLFHYTLYITGVLPEIQNITRNGFHQKIDDKEGGLLQTSFILTFMLLSPLFGYLGDRYTRKYLMAVGIFIWSGFVLLGSFSVVC